MEINPVQSVIRKKADGSVNPTYSSWLKMRARTRPGDFRSKWYADRGIRVCERWGNYSLFVEDMGERPAGTTLDRIDNDRGYEPGNCRWATKKEQQSNTSANRLLEFNGEKLIITEWGRRTGLGHSLIHYRLKLGWTVERALTAPPLPKSGSPKNGH